MKNYSRILILVTSLIVPLGALGANVVADGKTWMQVTETTATSWNTFADSCNTGTGVCGGTTYGGWTWASMDEVGALFTFYSGLSSPASVDSSLWAPSFLADFSPTSVTASDSSVWGWTRDTSGSNADIGLYALLVDCYNSCADNHRLDLEFTKDNLSPSIGAFMYVTTPVPEPEIYAMLGVGLGLMGWAGRRRRQQAA